MIEVIKEVLSVNDKPFLVPMKFYESVEEADLAAGKKGACLEECNLNLAYRGTYADARSLIVSIVQDWSQVPFTMVDTGEKDAAGKPILERDPKDTDAKYVKRVFALGKLSFDEVQAEVTRMARGHKYKDAAGNEIEEPALAVDIKATERKGGPKKLAQKWKDYALSYLKGEKNLDKFIAACKRELGVDFKLPVPDNKLDATNVEPLGWLSKAWDDHYAEKQRLAREAEAAKMFAN
jgi:hypothetical protein